jgi:hypothetical protein
LAAEFLPLPIVLLALPVLLPAVLLSLSFAQFLFGLRDDAIFFRVRRPRRRILVRFGDLDVAIYCTPVPPNIVMVSLAEPWLRSHGDRGFCTVGAWRSVILSKSQ